MSINNNTNDNNFQEDEQNQSTQNFNSNSSSENEFPPFQIEYVEADEEDFELDEEEDDIDDDFFMDNEEMQDDESDETEVQDDLMEDNFKSTDQDESSSHKISINNQVIPQREKEDIFKIISHNLSVPSIALQFAISHNISFSRSKYMMRSNFQHY